MGFTLVLSDLNASCCSLRYF